MRRIKERGLSPVQRKAVLEFISPNNGSQKDIARRVGVTPRTLRNWNRSPEFREALEEAMEDLRKGAIDSSLFAVRIEALSNMAKHEVEVVETFNIKGAIVSLGEKQVLLEQELKENREEMERLRNVIRELDVALGNLKGNKET